MKKNAYFLWILLMGIFLITGTVYGRDVVVKNETIVAKQPDTYMEVRHIVLSGSNREIGKALGEIAQKWLTVKLGKFAGPFFAQANKKYMERNYPIFLERMRGVAAAYGLPAEDNEYYTAALPFDIGPFACSALYIPGTESVNGHTMVGHNLDNYKGLMTEMSGLKPMPGNQQVFSRTYVMELYPDKGYSSIAIGSLDLLGGLQGGMNSKGMVVNVLTDQKGLSCQGSSTNGKNCGLSGTQPMRLILDTCATVEEAKLALMTNKFAPIFEPMHFLVSDPSGKSFAFEVSAKDGSTHITDNNGKPIMITNHPLFMYPDVEKFPSWPAKATYNTFYRYKVLYDFVRDHKGKFSVEDIKTAMSHVYGRTQDSDEGALFPLPVRTFFAIDYDLTDRTLEVKFYKKDGPIDPKTGELTLVFTEPFKFSLANK